MRKKTNLFQVKNGSAAEYTPIYAPDSGLSVSAKDLDSSVSGRDAMGYMHRSVLRAKTQTWNLKYSSLNYEEMKYMVELLCYDSEDEDSPISEIDIKVHKSIGVERDATTSGASYWKTTTAYCSGYSYSLALTDPNGADAIYNGVTFNLVEC